MKFAAVALALALLAGACSNSDDEPQAAPDDDASAESTDTADGDDAAERDVTESDVTESDVTDEPTDTTTPTDEDPLEEEPIVATPPVLDVAVDGSTIALTWEDTGGVRWEVMRNGRSLDTTGSPTFTDADLADGAYQYQVVAIGSEGDRAESEVVIAQVGPIDVIAPPAPTGVTVAPADDQIVISWTPPAELDDVRGYLVHRDRVFIAYVDDATEYVDTDIESGRAYTYRIRSQDDAGNVSEPEGARTDGVDTDVTPPSTPEGATIERDGDEIVITWQEATDDEGIWGYLIHRDGEFVVWTGLETEFREAAPLDGSTPTYVVRSQDFTGNYSEPTEGLTLTP